MEFSDSKYMTASEKIIVYRAFLRFLKSGLKESLFTKPLYKYLSLHFGFIAHFDKSGFYMTRFADPRGRMQTFERIIRSKKDRWEVEDGFERTGDLSRAIISFVESNFSTFIDHARAERVSEIQQIRTDLDQELIKLNR